MGHAVRGALFVVIVLAHNDAVSTLGIGKNPSPHGSGSDTAAFSLPAAGLLCDGPECGDPAFEPLSGTV